jgi:hypothetical protein
MPPTRAVIERAYHGHFLLLCWFRDTLCEGEVERAREAAYEERYRLYRELHPTLIPLQRRLQTEIRAVRSESRGRARQRCSGGSGQPP